MMMVVMRLLLMLLFIFMAENLERNQPPLIQSSFSLLRSAQDHAQCEITHNLEGSSTPTPSAAAASSPRC
jgi:hypothetical protein